MPQKDDSVYTEEKIEIWQRKMDEAGRKLVNSQISWREFLRLRAKLRKELGFP